MARPLTICWMNRRQYFPMTDTFSAARLREHGIEYTTSVLKADVLVCRNDQSRLFRNLLRFLPRSILMWANEPRFVIPQAQPKGWPARIKIMSVYTGDVFWHNLHFLGTYHCDPENNLGIDLERPPGRELTDRDLRLKTGFCVAVFGYRDPPQAFDFQGRNLDLYEPRQNLAKLMHRLGQCDIVGNGWPAECAPIEKSSYDNASAVDWWTRKLQLLGNYRFNLCFENTCFPYYCTEKIWHAIAGGSLPIYHGQGTRIYETFPADSFVDAASFKSNEELVAFLERMPAQEYLRRYNLCLGVLKASCAARLARENWKAEIVDRFASGIKELRRS